MSLEHELAALRAVWARGGTWSLAGGGASMWPALRPADVLTFGPRREAPAPGQIWLYVDRASQRLVAHRLVGPAPGGGWLLRGDAMPKADPPVSDGDLLGPLLTVRRQGRLVSDAWEAPYLRMLQLIHRRAPGLLRLARVAARWRRS